MDLEQVVANLWVVWLSYLDRTDNSVPLDAVAGPPATIFPSWPVLVTTAQRPITFNCVRLAERMAFCPS